ncbi:hypothetical protein V493_07602, partial [Pseudogymnoascus sp. VKM F-4281 (FW-2241)]
MAEQMPDPMAGLENSPLQPPEPSQTAPSSPATTVTLDGHCPLETPQVPNEEASQSDDTP